MPSQGFHPFYLDRPYLDDKLSYNYQEHKHTIITGKPLDGKTRSVFELCNQLKDQDVLIFFRELINIQMEDFNIPETNAEIIIFFDDLEQFLLLENLDKALKKCFGKSSGS